MLTHAKSVARLPNASVEYLLAGAGEPPIILLNGGDGPIEGWYKVLPKLTQASSVLAYNRAGIGRTSKSDVKQTSPVVVSQLRQLLRQVDLRPPYLLVGHSLGGLHANYFARAYPDEVCGMVLLDATAPADVDLMASHRSGLQKRLQRAVDQLFDRRALGEARNASFSAECVGAAGRFPDVPLNVVSGGTPAMARRMPLAAREGRLMNQQDLSRLSERGRHVIAERSGHFPQFSEPDLVASAILDILDQARRLA